MNPQFLKRIVAHYVKEPQIEYRPIFRAPEDIVGHFKYLASRDREEFLTLHLDKSNGLLCWDQVSVGTVDQCIVSPRDILKVALLSNAAALILLHNHPSERSEPSSEDREITRRVMEAATLFDIKILDHLIVGNTTSYFSFREHGLLKL